MKVYELTEHFAEEAGKDLFIEMATDRTQCIMYYIVKNGRLPPGFTMDPRIEKRAKTPINISEHKDELNTIAVPLRLEKTIGWLEFQRSDAAEMAEPIVNFGVF
jgi:hypothetical protein